MTIDFASSCFGCGKAFKEGDERLRFTMDEWAAHEGLEPTGVDIDIGLCAECVERGDFKEVEIVGGES